MEYAIHFFGKAQVMGHDNKAGIQIPVQLLHQLIHPVRRLAIQVTGWFVGQHTLC